MKAVVASIAPLLKEAGFKKRSHTFNREVEPGLVHVVRFQMGSYPLGSEIPGFRPNLYGRFTVNLGVFVHEMHELVFPTAPPAFVTEGESEFRTRLGILATGSDVWWSLDLGVAAVQSAVEPKLHDYANPWFEMHESRDAILSAYSGESPPKFALARRLTTLAVMRSHRGEQDAARELLRRDLSDTTLQPAQREFKLGIAEKLGFVRSEFGH